MADPDQLPVGFARVAVSGTFGPATWTNVLYCSVDPTGTPTNAQVIADIGEFAADLYDSMDLGNLSENFSVSTQKVFWQDAEGSVQKGTVADAKVGTNSGGDAPAQVCYLLEWTGGDARRGGKPRTYVCGVPEDKLADTANLTTDVVSSINSGLLDWIAKWGDSGAWTNGTEISLVEMSFREANAERVLPQDYILNTGHVSGVVATQRRRVDRLR